MILALLCAFAQGAWAQNYNVWDGHSEQQPTIYTGGYWVLIDNAANLAYVRNHWNDIASGENQYYKMGLYLRADLDMSAASWIPLGFNGNDYEGTFDGNGHTIKIRIEGGDDNGRALFDEIDEYATVKNLHVDGYINVGDAEYVAGIVSDNNGLIENCWVSANITSNHYNLVNDADLGGIAGQNSGLIRYCCMTGNVTNTAGNSGVGGLVGRNNGRDYMRSPGQPLHAGIYHCTFYGSVSVDHAQNSKYVGQNNGSTHYQYDAFNQTEYDSASGNNMYRRAIKYPYSVTVNTVGPGSIRTEAAGELDVPGTYPDATFTLHVTSGSVARVTITDADGTLRLWHGQATNTTSFQFVMERKNITAKFVFYENWPTQGTGTDADPYLISSADDWNKFAHNVTLQRHLRRRRPHADPQREQPEPLRRSVQVRQRCHHQEPAHRRHHQRRWQRRWQAAGGHRGRELRQHHHQRLRQQRDAHHQLRRGRRPRRLRGRHERRQPHHQRLRVRWLDDRQQQHPLRRHRGL